MMPFRIPSGSHRNTSGSEPQGQAAAGAGHDGGQKSEQDQPGYVAGARSEPEAKASQEPLEKRNISVTPSSQSLEQWKRLAIVLRMAVNPPPVRDDERKLHCSYNQPDYSKALKLCLPDYQSKHQLPGYQPAARDDEIQKAWLMYQAARDNDLGLLLLGKSDIRLDGVLVCNFGYTSVHGTEHGVTEQLAWEGTQKRRKSRSHPDEPHNQLLGPGSVLCDRGWSLMLNDAFILGGVHGDSQFELALPALAGKNSDADVVGLIDAEPELFWPAGQPYPAVLMRELTGLRMAGYAPHRSSAGLSFSCVKPRRA
ncbi:hypothetical protein [Spongorhabdus nitratireducens]